MMHKQRSFPLRLNAAERERAKTLAGQLGISENRLYAELIHDGLLMREQMNYFAKLRAMRVSAEEGLEILDQAPDVEPAPEDRR